jgi:hypothetical protein
VQARHSQPPVSEELATQRERKERQGKVIEINEWERRRDSCRDPRPI